MKNRNAIAICLVLLQSASLFGAFEPRAFGGRSIALGSLCGGSRYDCWSLFANPAAAAVGLPSLGCSFSPGLFGLRDLRVVGASALLQSGGWGFGPAVSCLGGELYREIQVFGDVGKHLSENAAAGFSVQLYHLRIEGYGSALAAGISLGTICRITESLDLALHASNITGATIGECKEELPQNLVAALSLAPIPDLIVVLEGRKESGMPASIALGGECRVVPSFFLRLGMSDESTGLTGGAGVSVGSLHLDYGFHWHRELGLTHALSITLTSDP
jgi:hypothetical protein